MTTSDDCDFLIVGGGFYGACLALFLRSLTPRVTLVEADGGLLQQASRINQARIHTGFHYPRSSLTAVKSLMLHKRFMRDFSQAVVDDFEMLYAIARRRSKVSAKRFHASFSAMGAPIARATPSQAALFDASRIEAVFACREAAFDARILEDRLTARLEAAGVRLVLGRQVTRLDDDETGIRVMLDDGAGIRASRVFNVTYAGINRLLRASGLPAAPLKHEWTEIALVTPPPALARLAVTVMDGPFFSLMPYPPAGDLYSLTHVRYTPHRSWRDDTQSDPGVITPATLPRESRHRHMILDGARYLPCLAEARWQESLYAMKTILARHEHDDARPILYMRKPQPSRVTSILGAKIDNVYDLFDLIRSESPVLARADTRYLLA